jgi:hypothetical protein
MPCAATQCEMTPRSVIATSVARKQSPTRTEPGTASSLALLAVTESVSLEVFPGVCRHSVRSDTQIRHCDERSEEAIPDQDRAGDVPISTDLYVPSPPRHG